jgi:hypothetical protein
VPYKAGALIAVAVLAAACGTARAAGPGTFVIQGDRSIGGIVLGRTTAPRATRRFAGEGARRVHHRPNACVVTWRRIGLSVLFGTLGTDPTDPCTGGTAFVVTLTSRAHWRTSVGLRVGDGIARVQALYPRAPRRSEPAGYWLVTRRACAEVGGGAYPALLARVRRGRVSALVATAGICD